MSESVNYKSLEKGTHVMNSYGDVLDNSIGHSIKLDAESKKTFIDLISVRKERQGVLMLIDSDKITLATPINYRNIPENKQGTRIEEGVGIYVTDNFSIGLDGLLNETYTNIMNHKGKGPYTYDLVFDSFEVLDNILEKIKDTPGSPETKDAVHSSVKENTKIMADFSGIQAVDWLLNERKQYTIYIGNTLTSKELNARNMIITDVPEGIKKTII